MAISLASQHCNTRYSDVNGVSKYVVPEGCCWICVSDERRQGPWRGPASFLLAHRWPERGSTGWQLRHEGVSAAVEAAVEGALGGEEVGGGVSPVT